MDVIVRRARLRDAPGIAAVHVSAWQDAYAGILPSDYLAGLSIPRLAQFYGRTIASGGGVHNATMMRMLAQCLRERSVHAPIESTERFGVAVDAKEALLFAVLAYEFVSQHPNNVPTCTGASRAVVMGKLCPGANYRALLTPVISSARAAE